AARGQLRPGRAHDLDVGGARAVRAAPRRGHVSAEGAAREAPAQGAGLHALDHVIVLVSELEAATRDAARLLGRTPSWRGEHPGQGTANALFRLENTYLELLAPVGPGALADPLRARLAHAGEGP